MSDEDLARKIALGRDQEAFRELVGRHLPRIRRLLAGLWAGIDRFRFVSSFRTWLYRFCRNRAIDLLRREGRHRRRGEAAARAAAIAASVDAADPVDGLEREQRRARVREALATLGADERLLVVMKDVEELGIAQIAATMGLPEGTVKSRLHRAREKLARRLGEGAAS